jgi:hypothetical protein
MTPPAPEIGWPPASNMSEKLTARRALLGQKGSVAAMVISCELVGRDKDRTAIAAMLLLPRSARRVMGMAAFVMGVTSALAFDAISLQRCDTFSHHS